MKSNLLIKFPLAPLSLNVYIMQKHLKNYNIKVNLNDGFKIIFFRKKSI